MGIRAGGREGRAPFRCVGGYAGGDPHLKGKILGREVSQEGFGVTLMPGEYVGFPVRVKGALWLHSSSVELQEGGRADGQGGSQRPESWGEVTLQVGC